MQYPVPGSWPTAGPPQRAQLTAGTGGEQNLALPPQARPQVRTCRFFGVNVLPQTTHTRSATGAASSGNAIRQRLRGPCGATTRPDASIFMTISGSKLVTLALADAPSPSHAPRAYGGIGRSASGRSRGRGMHTAWLGRRSAVGQRIVPAICSVVITSGGTGLA